MFNNAVSIDYEERKSFYAREYQALSQNQELVRGQRIYYRYLFNHKFVYVQALERGFVPSACSMGELVDYINNKNNELPSSDVAFYIDVEIENDYNTNHNNNRVSFNHLMNEAADAMSSYQ